MTIKIEEMRWHYAVWRGVRRPTMMPACDTPEEILMRASTTGHGITKVRGHVNCPDCLRAMGVTQ